MELKQAQQIVDKTIIEYGGYWEPLSMLARLMEEVGELSRCMNIKFGQKRSKNKEDGNEIEEELSDILFTTLAIANKLNINLEEEFESKLIKDHNKYKEVYKNGRNQKESLA